MSPLYLFQSSVCFSGEMSWIGYVIMLGKIITRPILQRITASFFRHSFSINTWHHFILLWLMDLIKTCQYVPLLWYIKCILSGAGDSLVLPSLSLSITHTNKHIISAFCFLWRGRQFLNDDLYVVVHWKPVVSVLLCIHSYFVNACQSAPNRPLPRLLCAAVKPPWIRLELQLQGGRRQPKAYGLKATLYFHPWLDNIYPQSLSLNRDYWEDDTP